MAACSAPVARCAGRPARRQPAGRSAIAASVRSLPRSASAAAKLARSVQGRERSRFGEGAAPRFEDVGRRQRDAGIDQQDRARRQRRRRREPLAHARGERRTAGEAHRHVGAQPRRQIEQLLDRQRHAPQVDQRLQRRRGIGRAAAEAGRHGNALGERERHARRHAGPIGQQARGLQHQIVGFARRAPTRAGRRRSSESRSDGAASISSARSVKATSESSR